MKKKISISIDENTIDKLELCVQEGNFRNKSHMVETAIHKLMKEMQR